MKQNKSETSAQASNELNKLNECLRDSSFAVKAAAIHKNNDTNNQEEAILTKPFKDEKIAINLAGFYAAICGVNAISAQTGKKPGTILKEVVEQKLDSNQTDLLNRFANTTWKASQPFRDINRINRDNFIVFAFLSEPEVQKDYDQILAASARLLTQLKESEDSSKEYQLQQLQLLLQDTTFAYNMAAYMEAAYYKGQNQPVPPFISNQEDTATITKTKKEQNIATGLVSFYALACGAEYLSKLHNHPLSEIIQSVAENTVTKEDKDLLQRFADATGKVSQAFTNLTGISKPVFIPFDFLPSTTLEKSWTELQATARLLLPALK